MKTRTKTILLALVFIVPALVVCLWVVHKFHHAPDRLPAKLMHSPNVWRDRIMPSLEKESLDQSIELMLDDNPQYFMPVRHTGLYSEDDLENVLSDRRTLKLLQEISALPKGKGSAACQLLFSTAFQRHTNACRAMIKYVTDPSTPENHYSTLCSLMAMSAAMFIAADRKSVV